MEVRTTDPVLARKVRVALAEHDIPVAAFAERAGLSRQTLANVLHARTPIGELARIKVDRALENLARQADGVAV